MPYLNWNLYKKPLQLMGGENIKYGSIKLKSLKKEDLNVNGFASLVNIEITNNLTVIGSVLFTGLEVHGLTKITGNLAGKNGKFETVNIIGSFQVGKSKFKNINIEATTNPIVINDTEIDVLHIDNTKNKLQEIIMLGKSNIGSMTVDGEKVKITKKENTRQSIESDTSQGTESDLQS